jgi:hypothetical protein
VLLELEIYLGMFAKISLFSIGEVKPFMSSNIPTLSPSS